IMRKTKNQETSNKNDADGHMDQKHPQRELIGVSVILGPFHESNGNQVGAGSAQQGDAAEGEEQEYLQARANGRLVRPALCVAQWAAGRRPGKPWNRRS